MAKNFPYFKFIATEWMTGDIVFEELSVQGLFINICALYWQRNGTLSVEDINKRFKNPVELKELTDRFISVIDGFISVKFLDEQLIEANHISKVNSQNGSKGGRPKQLKTLEEKPTANRPLTDSKPKKSKEEKEEEVNNIINPNLTVDFEKLKSEFNLLTGKNTRIVSTKVKNQIKARLKEGYSKQDLWNAIVNCFNDPYHKENPKYLTLEFISRSDKMEKYCENLKPKKPKEDKL